MNSNYKRAENTALPATDCISNFPLSISFQTLLCAVHLIIICLFFLFYLQNEISEVFDKLKVEDENNVTVIEPTVIDNCGCNGSNIESPQSITISSKTAERPSLRTLNNGAAKSIPFQVDDWSSLAQFEKLIKLEMENLACTANNNTTVDAETPKKIITSVSTTAVKSNILKPEKHVSDAQFFFIIIFFAFNSIKAVLFFFFFNQYLC